MVNNVNEIDKYIVRRCRVVSSSDDDIYYGGRIKVYIPGIDSLGYDGANQHISMLNTTFIENLPYCFPLMPKLLHVMPKKNEYVLVFLEMLGGSNCNRYYIGPVISQPYFMEYDSYLDNTHNLLAQKNNVTPPLPTPNRDGRNKGTLPNNEDVAIIGRGNSDITLKKEELLLRCGYKNSEYTELKDSLQFNTVDPAYIMMRYEKSKEKEHGYSSTINIVADRINLLSHDSRDNDRFNLTDNTTNKMYINSVTENDIQSKAHPLPYGDNLVAFLRDLLFLFKTHEHKFAKREADFSPAEQEKLLLLETSLNEMLSQSIKIN